MDVFINNLDSLPNETFQILAALKSARKESDLTKGLDNTEIANLFLRLIAPKFTNEGSKESNPLQKQKLVQLGAVLQEAFNFKKDSSKTTGQFPHVQDQVLQNEAQLVKKRDKLIQKFQAKLENFA